MLSYDDYNQVYEQFAYKRYLNYLERNSPAKDSDYFIQNVLIPHAIHNLEAINLIKCGKDVPIWLISAIGYPLNISFEFYVLENYSKQNPGTQAWMTYLQSLLTIQGPLSNNYIFDIINDYSVKTKNGTENTRDDDLYKTHTAIKYARMDWVLESSIG